MSNTTFLRDQSPGSCPLLELAASTFSLEPPNRLRKLVSIVLSVEVKPRDETDIRIDGTNTAMPHNAHGSWSASATAIGSSNVAVPVQAKGQVTRPAQVAGSDEVTDPDHITDPDQVMDSVEVANPVQSPGFAAPVQSPGSATPVQSSSSGTPGQLIRPQLPVWDCIQLVLRGNGWRRAGEIHESIGQLCDSRGWDNYAPQTVRKTLMCKKRDSNKLMVKNGHPPTYQLV